MLGAVLIDLFAYLNLDRWYYTGISHIIYCPCYRRKVEKNIRDKEEKTQEIAKRVQEMQGMMQGAAAEAAKLAVQEAA